jgi:hypothetical protein
VAEEGVEEALQVLGGLFVGKPEHLLDDLVDGAVAVCPRGIDVEEEPLKERALALGATWASQRTNRPHWRR